MPETALDLARGCGNPTGFAQLQPGEVVVDFGCGGGIDVILAAHKVGPQGKVVGIDMAPHMIEQAKQAVAAASLQDRDIEFKVVELEKYSACRILMQMLSFPIALSIFVPTKRRCIRKLIAFCDPTADWPSLILSWPKPSILTFRSAFAPLGPAVWEEPYRRPNTGRW